MARVGDEIRSHSLGRIAAAAIRELDQFQSIVQGIDAQLPSLVGVADSDQQDRFTIMLSIRIRKTIGSGWVTNGNPDVFADNMISQNFGCCRIGRCHFGVAYQQDRIGNRIDNVLISFGPALM